MLRVVLDTNVLVSAAISRGAPHEIVMRWLNMGDFEVIVSKEILAEMEAVLVERSKLRRWISQEEAREYVEVLRTAATLRVSHEIDVPELRDLNDMHVLGLAIGNRVTIIVTGDDDLHALDVPEVTTLTPAEFEALLSRGRSAEFGDDSRQQPTE